MTSKGEANGGEVRKAAAEERTAQLAQEAGEAAAAQANNTVVRIEGDSGELWQNAHLTPEGAPIEQ